MCLRYAGSGWIFCFVLIGQTAINTDASSIFLAHYTMAKDQKVMHRGRAIGMKKRLSFAPLPPPTTMKALSILLRSLLLSDDDYISICQFRTENSDLMHA